MPDPINTIELTPDTIASTEAFWAQITATHRDGDRWRYDWVEVQPDTEVPSDGLQSSLGAFVQVEEGRFSEAPPDRARNSMEWSNAPTGVQGSGDLLPPQGPGQEPGSCVSKAPELRPIGVGAVVWMHIYRDGEGEEYFFSTPNNVSMPCTAKS